MKDKQKVKTKKIYAVVNRQNCTTNIPQVQWRPGHCLFGPSSPDNWNEWSQFDICGEHNCGKQFNQLILAIMWWSELVNRP